MYMPEDNTHSAAGDDLNIYQKRRHWLRIALASGTSNAQEIEICVPPAMKVNGVDV
ncbi:hypothetical protein I5S53_10575 [Pseudomonas juntendi]|uniref:hypothetical protein n=1 Tax=Pseudomonas TaxID=286 RepID=UPI0012DF064A|nr:hypothetical protein [Pseudomonas juntendi]